ncbi:ion channel [Eupransor demetentiae]
MYTKVMKALYYFASLVLAIVAILLSLLDITGVIHMSDWPYNFINYSILLYFWIDYVTRFTLAKNKWDFFKKNIFDLIAIMPFDAIFSIFRVTRAVKIIKILQVVRIVGFSKKLQGNFARFFKTNGFIYVLLSAIAIMLLGGGVYALSEDTSFGDGIWWAIATTTTVGYGDISPHTILGKVVAGILMIVGIGLIGSITSTVTSFFVHQDQENENDKIEESLSRIEERLAQIEKKLDQK